MSIKNIFMKKTFDDFCKEKEQQDKKNFLSIIANSSCNEEFKKSCRKFLKNKGFLTPKQIAALNKNYYRPHAYTIAEEYESYEDWRDSLSFEQQLYLDSIPNQ